MTHLPLHTLLALLEARGLRPDLNAQVRLQALLQAKGGEALQEGPDALCLLLSPVVAKSPKEQELFAQVFAEYWQFHVLKTVNDLQQWMGDGAVKEEMQEELPSQEKETHKPPKHWLWRYRWVALAMLLPFAALLAYLLWPKPPIVIPEEKTCEPPGISQIRYSITDLQQGKPTALSAATLPALDSLYIWWEIAGQTTLADTLTYKLPQGKEQQVTVKALRKAIWKGMEAPSISQLQAIYDTATCDRAVYAETLRGILPLPDLQGEKLVENTRGWAFFTQKAWLVLASTLFLLWLLLELAIWLTRKQRLHLGKEYALQTGEAPPLELPFPAQKLPQDAPLADLAAAMRLRQRGERQSLHVAATIKASIAAGGWPKLQYRHNTEPTEYLLLIEGGSADSFHTLAGQALAKFLQQQEVLLDAFVLHRNKAFSAAYPQGLTFDNLLQRFPKHRLLFMGEGRAFINSRRGQLDESRVGILRRWADRLLLTPTPLADWGYQEEQLAQLFQVMPHTWQGMLQGIRLQHEERLLSVRHIKEQPLQFDATPSLGIDWRNAEAMRQFLGQKAFAALCMAQVYAQSRWEIGLAMLGAVGGSWDDAFRLARVPWLQEGNMPGALRTSLLQQLTEEQERRARQTLLQLLEEAVQHLPDNAYSRKEWEEQHAFNAFLLEPANEEKAANAYKLWQQGRPADTPQRLYLAAKPNLLPDAPERFFYQQFAPVQWAKLAMRGAAILLLGLALWQILVGQNATPQLQQWDEQYALQPKNLVAYNQQADSLAMLNNGYVEILPYLMQNSGNKRMEDDMPQQGLPQANAPQNGQGTMFLEAETRFAQSLASILPRYAEQTQRLDTVYYNQQLLQYVWGRQLYQAQQWSEASQHFARLAHERLREEGLHARGICAFYQGNTALAQQLADSISAEFWMNHSPNLRDVLPKTSAETAFREKHAKALAKLYDNMQGQAKGLAQKMHPCKPSTLALLKTDTSSVYSSQQLQVVATHTYAIDCMKEGAWQVILRTATSITAEGHYTLPAPEIKLDKQVRETPTSIDNAKAEQQQ